MEDRDSFAKFADHKFPASIGDEMQSLMDRMHDEAIKMAADDSTPATPAEQPDQRAGEVEAVLEAVRERKAIYQTKLYQATEHERFSDDYSRCDLFRHAVEAFEYLEADIAHARAALGSNEG